MSKDDDRTSVNETIPKTAHSINISRILSHFKANLKSCVNVLASRAKIGNIRQELPWHGSEQPGCTPHQASLFGESRWEQWHQSSRHNAKTFLHNKLAKNIPPKAENIYWRQFGEHPGRCAQFCRCWTSLTGGSVREPHSPRIELLLAHNKMHCFSKKKTHLRQEKFGQIWSILTSNTSNKSTLLLSSTVSRSHQMSNFSRAVAKSTKHKNCWRHCP